MEANDDLLVRIQTLLADREGNDFKLRSVAPVSGGNINYCYRLRFPAAEYFLKLNDAGRYPHMFAREAEGLSAIAATDTVTVPEVIATGSCGTQSFLLMEWIEQGRATSASQILLGRRLAEMHRHGEKYVGFGSDNYIGSLKQVNGWLESWGEFFIFNRINVQLKLAHINNLINKSLLNKFDTICTRISTLFPGEEPSLLHGDLWAGNYLVGPDGTSVLIDPAVYYGHREMDIAMTRLFGGFNERFYDSYNEAFPLQADWQERIDLWNLYPLLVHVNLFGAGYLPEVERCVNNYL